jgi:predicted TIM-barrel fold metal-dependent hydrolase
MASSPAPLEPVLEPDLPIVDPHHHLMYSPAGDDADPPPSASAFLRSYAAVAREHRRYLAEDLFADVGSGHDIRATVFVDSRSMYRRSGPAELRLVGEVEFANGVAAMGESGLFGSTRVCAGIVGGVDLDLGAGVEDVLHAQIAAGNGRFRGVRASAMAAVPSVFEGAVPDGWLGTATVREGVARLAPLGLSLDVTVLEPQLGEVADLARAFPETSIVLDHVGFPLGIGIYEGRRDERFAGWRRGIRDVAACENVTVKLGGLGTPFGGFDSFRADPPADSERLAADWRPYIEACIEAFGTSRSMFESNYPADAGAGSYATIWNALKRIAAGASPAEKVDLFAGTATHVYRLSLPPVE